MKNLYICTYRANYNLKLHHKEIKEGEIFTCAKDDNLKRLMHQGKVIKLTCSLVRARDKFATTYTH